jgi:hypothetical protein
MALAGLAGATVVAVLQREAVAQFASFGLGPPVLSHQPTPETSDTPILFIHTEEDRSSAKGDRE